MPVCIHEEEVEGDYGFVDGLRVTCSRCEHYVDVAGTTGSSARRGALLLRQDCPRGESNFYATDWEE